MEVKRVFVTGANSLLGTNLIIELLNQKYQVKGLVRNLNSYRGVSHQNLELIQGNIFDDLDSWLENCHFVVHTAAETRQNLCHYSAYRKTNVEGTINIANASIRQQIDKFVYVSTANTIGYGDLTNPGNEKQKIKDPYTRSHYAESKLEAENYLLNQTDKIKIVIANPTFMIGAYDSKPTSGKIILMNINKRVVLYPQGGRNFIHVKDVANGLIRCLEHGKTGEKYLLAGTNLSYYQFFKKVIKHSQRHPLFIKIPKSILVAAGLLGDLLRRFNIPTIISSSNMSVICTETYYSNKKSVKDLQVHCQSIDNAISEALSYFKENNYY
jgi:nucleoside-diphosphate-sugar epimerase